MTLEQAQFIDQVAFWVTLIIGAGVISLILIYEKHSREKKS
jgi:hypothetical protein